MSQDVDEQSRRVPLGVRRVVAGLLLLLAAGITLGPLPVGLLDLATDSAQALAGRLPEVSPGRPRRAEVEAGLNILVPAVLVLLVCWSYPAINRLKVFAIGVGVSVLVETAQFFLPGRHPEPRDLMLNSLGVLVGVLVAWLTAQAWNRTVGALPDRAPPPKCSSTG